MSPRTAAEEDIEAIRRVAEQSWEANYPVTRETAEEAVNDWYDADRLREELRDGRTVLLVAERDGEVVGFAHATWNEEESEGYILRIYVHPEHRNEGVGRELLERARADLSDHDLERINAMVLADNDPGNDFYERFGFERADESETVIGGETYRENRYVLER